MIEIIFKKDRIKGREKMGTGGITWEYGMIEYWEKQLELRTISVLS